MEKAQIVHRYDINEGVNVIGKKKSRGLLGFHHFTGADYGGKYVGVSKKRWTDIYLELDNQLNQFIHQNLANGLFVTYRLTLYPLKANDNDPIIFAFT